MLNGDEVLRILGEKGWNLYADVPNADMPSIVQRGRVTSLQPGVPYHLLPYAHWDSNVDLVYLQLQRARGTNQLPSIRHRDGRANVRGLVLQQDSLILLLWERGQVVEFTAEHAVDGLRHDLSNFNTLFFDSIARLKEFCAERGWAPQISSPLPRQLRWQWVHRTGAGGIAIYPSDASAVLFRGQTKRYRPCVSTLGRAVRTKCMDIAELSLAEQAALFVSQVRSRWFAECVRRSPPFLWMREQRIYMDEIAVAQHYGLATHYIDLTQSLDVASFFACCRFDGETGDWHPMMEGEGVIYLIDRTIAVPDAEGDTWPCRPINLQPFPRPSEQWGWVYDTRLGEDFDSTPHVTKLMFRHDVALSAAILEHFRCGQALFPEDPTAGLAEHIRRTNELPLAIARAVATGPEPAPTDAEITEFILEASRQSGVAFTDNVADPFDAELQRRLNQVWKTRSPDFLHGVGFQAVRTLRTTEDGGA